MTSASCFTDCYLSVVEVKGQVLWVTYLHILCSRALIKFYLYWLFKFNRELLNCFVFKWFNKNQNGNLDSRWWSPAGSVFLFPSTESHLCPSPRTSVKAVTFDPCPRLLSLKHTRTEGLGARWPRYQELICISAEQDVDPRYTAHKHNPTLTFDPPTEAAPAPGSPSLHRWADGFPMAAWMTVSLFCGVGRRQAGIRRTPEFFCWCTTS